MSLSQNEELKAQRELILQISAELELRSSHKRNQKEKKVKTKQVMQNKNSGMQNKRRTQTVEVNQNKTLNANRGKLCYAKQMKLSLLFSGLRLEYPNIIKSISSTITKEKKELTLENKKRPFNSTKVMRSNKTEVKESINPFKPNSEADLIGEGMKTTSSFISPNKTDLENKDNTIIDTITLEQEEAQVNPDNKLLLKNPLVVNFKKHNEKINELPIQPIQEIESKDPLSVDQIQQNQSERMKIEKDNKHLKRDLTQFKKAIRAIDSYSHVGYSGPKKEKLNQDSSCMVKSFLKGFDDNESYFLSVCDGHGVSGHLISKLIVDILPKELQVNLNEEDDIIQRTSERDKIISDTFISINNHLVSNTDIDSIQSGTTCCSVILTPNSVISCNLGDSRAVIGRYANGKWSAIDLTIDHKPESPKEKERIIQMGGRVERFMDDYGRYTGPYRIWKKKEDTPGLAMSRSFGDQIAASVGAISEPEIKEFKLTAFDKILVIASDGIWEFMSSLECIEIISEFYFKNDIEGALEYIYAEANKRWIKEDDEAIDDITSIIAFFD